MVKANITIFFILFFPMFQNIFLLDSYTLINNKDEKNKEEKNPQLSFHQFQENFL